MKRRILYCVLIFSMVMMGGYVQVLASCNACDNQTLPIMAMDSSFKDETRYPQTILHDIVMQHLKQPLPEGKTTKKVLVLGYDGFREDALLNTIQNENSAISDIARHGGIYHSYAGADGLQATNTAPGWLSILSGKWAYEVGVVSNDDQKGVDTETFLSEAMQLGHTSTFLASWAPHFDVTYRLDITNPQNHVAFQSFQSDEDTVQNLHRVLQDTSVSGYDVVFATLEYADHTGHESGFGNDVEAYVNASIEADTQGYTIIQSIYHRDTYQQEDWLIILTSDHGGILFDHGGQSEEEVNTWFAMNKTISDFL